MIIAGVAALVPLAFTLYTDQVWEDFLITFRHSENLVAGNGLTYNLGTRVHGFTSPLGVLLLALFYAFSGKTSYVGALWGFRVVSIAAFSGGLLLLLSCHGEDTLNRYAKRALAALYVLNVKAVAYSVNGMETGLMLFFLAYALYGFETGMARKWFAGGIAFAGLMWTRPDGCVYIGCLSVVNLLYHCRPRKEVLLGLLKAGLLCTILYLPWFLWAWSYYGSPVPHTISAKSAMLSEYNGSLVSALSTVLKRLPDRARSSFAPIDLCFGGWPAWAGHLPWVTAAFSGLYWLFPTEDRFGRKASLTYLLLSLYLSYPAPYQWYFPPVAMCGLIALARGVFTLGRYLKSYYRVYRTAAVVFILLLCSLQAYIFGITALQTRVSQTEIEFGNRAQIGLWLRDKVRPNDTVYLEPLGYIGYYYKGTVADYPGLVSPEVVALRRQKRLNLAGVVAELKPDWIVVRPWEEQDMWKSEFFRQHYARVKVFDVTGRLRPYAALPGIHAMLFDARFSVYKMAEEASP